MHPDIETDPRDLDQALRVTGGSRELADELFAELLRDLPARLRELARSFERKDWTAMRESLHQLEGSTAVCALPALREQAQRLHGLIRDGKTEGIDDEFALLVDEGESLMRFRESGADQS
ncbi:MAG: Hpt domain-containing protein [Pseudomonadota bacterium]